MKNLFIVFLLMSVTLGTLSAQKIYLGPDLGVNLSPTSNAGTSQNYQLGFTGGLRSDFVIGKDLTLRTGLYFTQKKQGYDSLSIGSLVDAFGGLLGDFVDPEDLFGAGLNFDVYRQYNGVSTHNFIEIPLQVSYQTGRVNFSLGGYAAYMVSAESQATLTENTPLLQTIDLNEVLGEGSELFASFLPAASEQRDVSDEGTDDYNLFDYGIRGGISYVTEENLSFNLSYEHGLVDYRKNVPDDSAFQPFKNITFTLAYLIGVERKMSCRNYILHKKEKQPQKWLLYC